MFIIVGQVDVEPGVREEYLVHADTAMRASRAEEGCLDYTVTADRLDPARIHFFERWTDSASLKAHIASEHIASEKAFG